MRDWRKHPSDPAQQQASAGEVPEADALSAVRTAKLVMSGDVVSLAPAGWKIIAYALDAAEAALTVHEPALVDPLAAMCEEMDRCGAFDLSPSDIAKELRARGVTVAKGGE